MDTPERAECRCGEGPACGAGLVCDGGICQCRDDEDCGADQLCCANEQGIRECVGTDPATQCEACGVACNGERSNSCENRQCRCGDSVTCQVGTVCQDDAQTPEPDFQCRGCATNRQCDANTICCRGTCVRTDPEQQCEGCGVACDINVADFCAGVAGGLERSCVCGSGAGATACDGATPVCVLGQRPGEGTCRECRNDVDCTGNPDFANRNLRECVQNDCRRCDPVNHDGCGPNQLCCNDRCVDTVATGN